MKQILQNELSKKIHLNIVQEILKEYESVCKDFYVKDNTSILTSSGRFVDMVLAGINYWYDSTLLNLNTINFDSLCSKIIGLQRRTNDSEEDLLLLEIPNVAKAIYTIRNKKRGAHRKDFDPIMQDRVFVKQAVDWIMASLLFVFHTKSEEKIKGIIESLIQKEVSLIEEFEDGGMMILKKLSFSQKLLVILYKQSQMITKEELKYLIKPKYPQEFNTNLNNLSKDLLVYVNKENVKITQNGIKEVEEKILK
jgi:hypothetical protein